MTSFTYSTEARRHQSGNFSVLKNIQVHSKNKCIFFLEYFCISYREKNIGSSNSYCCDLFENLRIDLRAIIRYRRVTCFTKLRGMSMRQICQTILTILSDESLTTVTSNPKLCQSLYTSDGKQFFS